MYNLKDLRLGSFQKIMLPMIRRIIPSIISQDLVGVQPMSAPTSNLFTLSLDFDGIYQDGKAMMNIRQRSVNVSRTELLTKLKENRKIHAKEYAEMLLEYRQRLEADLKAAYDKVVKAKDNEKLKSFRFNVVPPQNYTSQYDEVIEMLEMSVDETINLDAESFKAYIKNEWSWSGQLVTTKALYASAGSFLG